MAILSLGLLIQEYLPHPVRFILRKRGAQLFAAHRPLLGGEEKIEIYLGCFAGVCALKFGHSTMFGRREYI